MLFTSYEFLGFAAAVLLLYYLLPGRFQWPLLLAASCLFYCFAGPDNLIYIVPTALTTWFSARRIARCARRQKEYLTRHKDDLSREEKRAYREKQKKIRFRWALACVLLNIGTLAVVKYTNFVISNVNGVMAAFGREGRLSFLDLALPMGISFYTFQAVGYLIDVYRGAVEAEENPFKLSLFLSFFPQLVQGPINRFADLRQTLFSRHPFDWGKVSRGLQRVLWGYFKKLVIADRILTAVNALIGDTAAYTGAYVLAGMLFYALELYADFTGGIDITIGMAEAMGITLTENFRRPYFSKSIKEYWRRWHMTMGSWFTDYIFYPVSVCKPMLKLSRFGRAHLGNAVGKRLPVYLSTFIVWLATGVWHGASWNFIAWGLGNWVVIMVSQELDPLYARFHRRFKVQGKLHFRLFQVVRTVLLMSCLRMFDCYRDVPLTFRMFASLLTARNWHVLWDGSLLALGLTWADYWVLGAGTVLLVCVSLVQRKGSIRNRLRAAPCPARAAVWLGLFLCVLVMGAYGVGYDASQFIYNQF